MHLFRKIAKEHGLKMPDKLIDASMRKAQKYHDESQGYLTKVKTIKRQPAKMKQALKERVENHNKLMTVKRGRGRPPKSSY